MTNIIKLDSKLLLKLPTKEFAARLMALNPKEGLNLLLDRSDSQEVVQAMPEQDFYLFVKDIGDDNATSVLGFAKIEQINHILDLEGWRRDQVLAGKTLAWLEAILLSSNQKFLEWLYKVDFELLVLLFKKWLNVKILPDDTEYIEVDDSFPSETIDDQFYFEVRYPQHRELIKSVLSFLFETHNSFYLELMNHVLATMDSEVEELAYHFHRGRLADNAIPDFGEAVSIYQPLQRTNIKQEKTVYDDGSEYLPAPFFAMMLVPKQTLLTEALARIDDVHLRKSLQTEFASLANKIIVADELEVDNPDNLRESADKATAYINLALEELAHGDAGQAAGLLAKIFIEDLFRLAHTRIKEVCHKCQNIVKTGWLTQWPYGINILDLKCYEQVSLLMGTTPMIMRQSSEGSGTAQEDLIRTKRDLQQVENLVQLLDTLALLYGSLDRLRSGSWEEIGTSLWTKAHTNNLDSVTLGSLLITATAQKLWQGNMTLLPLPKSQWPQIFPLLAPEIVSNTIYDYCTALFPDENDQRKIAAYLEPILMSYKEDMASSKIGSGQSPHLLPYLLFTDT